MIGIDIWQNRYQAKENGVIMTDNKKALEVTIKNMTKELDKQDNLIYDLKEDLAAALITCKEYKDLLHSAIAELSAFKVESSIELNGGVLELSRLNKKLGKKYDE